MGYEYQGFIKNHKNKKCIDKGLINELEKLYQKQGLFSNILTENETLILKNSENDEREIFLISLGRDALYICFNSGTKEEMSSWIIILETFFNEQGYELSIEEV